MSCGQTSPNNPVGERPSLHPSYQTPEKKRLLAVGAHGAAGEGSDRGDDLPRDCVHKPDPLPWRGRGDEGQLLALPLLHGSEQAAVRARLWSPPLSPPSTTLTWPPNITSQALLESTQL